jgi:hypothetical protein
MEHFRAYLVFTQAIIYIVLGLWPVVHMKSFLSVTGPKVETWLVRTVGLLITVIGITLLIPVIRKIYPPEIFPLGMLSALFLGIVDVIYVRVGRISKVYLIDAVTEFLLVVGWVLVFKTFL